jgi:hypothetical protein
MRRDDLFSEGRRALLRAAAGVAVVGPAAGAVAATRPAYPPDVFSKFHPDGRPYRFAGNTIVCHLDQQGERSAAFDAFLDIYREVPTLPFARKVGWLPPSSYHTTIFGGANDRPRVKTSWPADLPLDLPMADCNRLLGERLKGLSLDCALPIRLKVDLDQVPDPAKPLTLLLLPVDAAEDAKLRDLRNRISRVLAIRSPNHDAYRFHVSLGYPLAWFTDAEASAFQTAWRRWTHAVAAKSPVIELGAPEYCLFDDMFAFHRQFYLH